MHSLAYTLGGVFIIALGTFVADNEVEQAGAGIIGFMLLCTGRLLMALDALAEDRER